MNKSVLALSAAAFLGAASAQAASYAIDPTHTFVTFEIDHNKTSTNRGRFDQVEGSIQFDRAARTGKADVTVHIASVNTGTPDFDGHLRAPDIFNAGQFATARFVSTRFKFDGDEVDEVEGELTLLGRTLPVTLDAEKFNCYASPQQQGKEVCGGDFEAKIDRSRWGLDFGLDWGAAREVKIVIQIEAVRQD